MSEQEKARERTFIIVLALLFSVPLGILAWEHLAETDLVITIPDGAIQRIPHF